MCIELHKHSTVSMRELIELEREDYRPSQFERGSIADIAEQAVRAADKAGIAHGFELAKIKFHQLLLKEDGNLWARIAPLIEELKP